jgi:phosphoribosylformimino-5-aminoimidazole carboxamide ribotide isomerase
VVILPAIDLHAGRCVRLRQGDFSRETVYGDDPLAVARHWLESGANWLHLVDLDGAKTGRPQNVEKIQAIVAVPGLKCQLGGGLRTEADLEAAFAWGVARAVVGTQALRDWTWLERMARRFPQRLLLGLDARNGLVATDGWLKLSSTPAAELAQRCQDLPLAGIVYTDIDHDGMLSGPNFAVLGTLVATTQLPIFASGGIAHREHVQKLAASGLAGCIIGRALYEHTLSLADALAAALFVSGSTGHQQRASAASL